MQGCSWDARSPQQSRLVSTCHAGCAPLLVLQSPLLLVMMPPPPLLLLSPLLLLLLQAAFAAGA